MNLWNFIVAHWGVISAASILVLKWVYNAGAFQDGVSLKQFMRALIGEVVQEPAAPPLTDAQRKLLAEAPHV
jgi:hypothetical protein